MSAWSLKLSNIWLRVQVWVFRGLRRVNLLPKSIVVGVEVTPNGNTMLHPGAIWDDVIIDGQLDPLKPWVGLSDSFIGVGLAKSTKSKERENDQRTDAAG